MQYIEHPERRFKGDIGVLERKHIRANGLIYIGKEANNIEDQPLDVEKPQLFIDEEKIKNFILALTPEEARKIGIKSKNGLNYLKKKAREGKLNFDSINMRKIIKYYYS